MESTSDIEELERVTAASVELMKRLKLKPLDWEAYTDSSTGELWVNIWFEQGPRLNVRRKIALDVLKENIRTKSSLPWSVNVEYEAAATDTGIAAWWLC